MRLSKPYPLGPILFTAPHIPERGTSAVPMSTPLASEGKMSPMTAIEAAYLLGPDRDGHWVAIEIHGLGGGLFRSREAAEHYAAFETGHRPGGVRMSDAPIEFAI